MKNIFKKVKISVLYDAILNIDDFNDKIKNKNFSQSESIPDNFFLSVGRLPKQKNYFYLLDEFKALCRKYPDQKLLIIGDGELRTKIEKSIKYKMKNFFYLN